MLKWFRSDPTPEDVLRTVRDQLGQLERGLEHQQADVKTLRLEWEETYDKVHKMMQRMNKRARDAEKKLELETSDSSESGVSSFRDRVLSRRRQ